MRADDGRRARWTEHRRARREDPVAAGGGAGRRGGPHLAVDRVAPRAAVCQTGPYRYFHAKGRPIDTPP